MTNNLHYKDLSKQPSNGVEMDQTISFVTPFWTPWVSYAKVLLLNINTNYEDRVSTITLITWCLLINSLPKFNFLWIDISRCIVQFSKENA